ncbi:hypothetical protein GQ44DRAFT_563476, partial [Phaeosphaeriaceae sp. PMI808]
HFRGWKSLVGALPSNIRADFKERTQALHKKTKDIREQFKELGNKWNIDNKTGHKEIQRNWIQQLDNDIAWET